MNRRPAIYILTNKKNRTLYTGSTADLLKRIYEHKNGTFPGFTARYGCKILVFYHFFRSLGEAMEAEKKIKGRSRLYKIQLIEAINPSWNDLYEHFIHENNRTY